MDSKRMLAICDEAMKLPREQRRRFLVAACDGDEDLLTGALGILRAIDDSGSFLTLPESTWDDE